VRLALALALAIVSAGAVAADDVFAHPATVAELQQLLKPAQAALADTQALRGRFEQRKFLSGIPQPLRSAGEFTFARDRGIWWHTVQPFESELVLTRAGIRERDASGGGSNLSAEQQPALRIVADVFLSLFALDPQRLTQSFQTYGRPAGPGWVLGLAPRAGALATAIGRVTIRGATRVEQVVLEDRHGDRTELELIDDGRGGGPLSAAEAARFEAGATGS
jgi:hypothetical protein